MKRISFEADDDAQAGLPRRYEALAFIIEQIARGEASPTHQEIGDRLCVSRARAEQFVRQLIIEKRVERVGRRLRVIDIDGSRVLLDGILRRLQWNVAVPMGQMLGPLAQIQLPMMPEIEQLCGIE